MSKAKRGRGFCLFPQFSNNSRNLRFLEERLKYPIRPCRGCVIVKLGVQMDHPPLYPRLSTEAGI